MLIRTLMSIGLSLGFGCIGSIVHEGQSLVSGEDYAGAIALYEDALSERSSGRLQAELQDARSLESARLTELARADLAANQPLAAFDGLSLALKLNPDNLPALDLLNAARDALLLQATSWERKAQPRQALSLYERVLSEYKRDSEAQAGAQRTRASIAEELYRKAEDLSPKSPAAALVAFVRADHTMPGYRDARIRAEALRDELVTESAQALFLTTGGAAAKGIPADTLPSLHDLVSHLNTQGWQIHGVERGVPSPGDLTVGLRIEAFQIRHQQADYETTQTLELVDNPRSNPAYPPMKAQVDEKIEDCKAKTSQAEAEQTAWLQARAALSEMAGSPRALATEQQTRENLAQAQQASATCQLELEGLRAHLAQLPEQLGDLRQIQATYTITDASASAVVALSGACKEVADEGVVEPIELLLKPTFSDSGHAAVPSLGLEADPLEVPEAQILTRQMQLEARRAIMDGVMLCRQRQNEAHWSQARRLAEAGWRDDAADAFVRVWLEDPNATWTDAFSYLIDELEAPEAELRAMFPTR